MALFSFLRRPHVVVDRSYLCLKFRRRSKISIFSCVVAFFATLLLAGFWASDKLEEYTGSFDEDEDE